MAAVSAAPALGAQQITTAPIVGVEQVNNPDSIVQPQWGGRQWVKYQGPIQLVSYPNPLKPQLNPMHIYVPHFFPEVINIQAPNGQLVPVNKCQHMVTVQNWEDSSQELRSDWNEEVASSDRPANTDPHNTTAYRVSAVFAQCVVNDPVRGSYQEIRITGTFDYSKFGYVKIGKVWVDPNRLSDVANAGKRIENENNAFGCTIL